MKWTCYLGPQAEWLGRFDSLREAHRAARHSIEPGSYYFCIARRSGHAKRLHIYTRQGSLLLDTQSWTLGTEHLLAEELLP